MSQPVDLSQCENEPIHIPGAIQPHGVLLGVRATDLRIVLASENAEAFLGVSPDVRGQSLDTVLDPGAFGPLRDAREGDVRDTNPLPTRLPSGQPALAILHRSDGLLVVEVEATAGDGSRFASDAPRLLRSLERLRHARTLQTVCDIAAEEVHALTQFERVMVYRFDRQANGAVIAEHRADPSLEPYLGLHYPASDIPPQARRLYVMNPIRVIVDVDYEPVLLRPAVNPLSGRPLDLSHAGLRSVSSVHCEYLRNMGVRASMSISLIHGDALWGLVACHSRQPLLVPYDVRLVGEFIAQVLSARVAEMARVEALTRKSAAYAVQTRLIDQMVSESRFQDGLSGREQRLTDLIDCDGAAVLYGGEVTRVGETPDEESIRQLGAQLQATGPAAIVATDCLQEVRPEAATYVDRAAGGIAVPLSTDGANRIFWFRREQVSSVTWAGDPSKAVVPTTAGSRLGPRASFAAWTEDVRGRSVPWEEWEVEVASDFRTALAASIIHQAAELERLNARLVAESQQKDRFLAAVSHDLRNPLNAILGWVRIARMDLGPAELDRALETIERNATAQNQLIGDLLDMSRVQSGGLQLESRPMNLAQVVRHALDTVEPSVRTKSIRVDTMIDEVECDVIGDPGRLQQVVWNLLTNALKFSREGSRVAVRLDRRGAMVALEIEDEGAGIPPSLLPHIFDPFRQGEGPQRHAGLGLGLSIAKSIVELHGGTLTGESEGEDRGARFTVSLPVAVIRSVPATPRVGGAGASALLTGVRILVVDDQADAAEMVAALLGQHGATAETTTRGQDAVERLRAPEPIDLVISDIELPEMSGLDLVKLMRGDSGLAGIPAIALTAHAQARDRAQALTAGFRHHVAKPVDPEELIAVVGSVLSRLPD